MNKRRILDAVIVFLIVILILLFAVPLFSSYLGLTGTFIGEVLFAGVVICAIIIRKEDVRERLLLSLPSISSFFFSLLLIFGSNMLQSSFAQILYAITGKTPNTNDTAFFNMFLSSVNPVIALITIALIPAICEEILFRGYLLSAFKSKKSSFSAVLITAFLFAVVHFDLYKFVPILIMGIVFGYLASVTGSLLLPCIFHFINNAMSLVSYYSTGTDSAENYIVLQSKSYIFISVASLGFAVLLIYLGVTLLSNRKIKKSVVIPTVIASFLIFGISLFFIISGEISEAFSFSDKLIVKEDTCIEKEFTLDKNTICYISDNYNSKPSAQIDVQIIDSDGETVYDNNSETYDMALLLKEGNYKVLYNIDIDESKNESSDVYLITEIISFAEFEQIDKN